MCTMSFSEIDSVSLYCANSEDQGKGRQGKDERARQELTHGPLTVGYLLVYLLFTYHSQALTLLALDHHHPPLISQHDDTLRRLR